MRWPVHQNRGIARPLAWFGIAAIFVLSVVPADERPVTGFGQVFEHLTACRWDACYRLSLHFDPAPAIGFDVLRWNSAQVPLPTRHARASDFAIDLLGSYFAIGLVAFAASRSRAAHSEAANR
jgi:hypothetical protein